jgi:hypothetical protein
MVTGKVCQVGYFDAEIPFNVGFSPTRAVRRRSPFYRSISLFSGACRSRSWGHFVRVPAYPRGPRSE